MTQIRVAALPISETGALWAAIEEGIFEEHGLEVEIVPAQGGAQAIPALLSGDIDFAIGQPFGPFRANLQNLGAVIIGNYSSALPDGKDVNAVVALDSSGIQGPADLAGKRVSVNSLGAAGDVTIMKAVEDAGGDPTTIQFVEVGFPDAQAQLESGNIDAAWVPDPFMSIIDGADGTIVVHPYQATIPGLPLLTNITLQQTIDDNRELVETYSEAMSEALEWASGNEEAVRAAIASNMGIPEQAAAGITLPEFTWDLDTDALEQLVDLAVEYGVLDQSPDFDALWAGFASVRDGLWLAPGQVDLAVPLRLVRNQLPAGSLLVFHARELAGFPIATAVRQAWDIDAIRTAHEVFGRTWSDPSTVAGAGRPLAAMTTLVADWLALLRSDPGLPREYMGADFALPTSVRVYEELRAELGPPARAEFEDLCAGRIPAAETVFLPPPGGEADIVPD